MRILILSILVLVLLAPTAGGTPPTRFSTVETLDVIALIDGKADRHLTTYAQAKMKELQLPVSEDFKVATHARVIFVVHCWLPAVEGIPGPEIDTQKQCAIEVDVLRQTLVYPGDPFLTSIWSALVVPVPAHLLRSKILETLQVLVHAYREGGPEA